MLKVSSGTVALAAVLVAAAAMPVAAASVTVDDNPEAAITIDGKTEMREFSVSAAGAVAEVELSVDLGKMDDSNGSCEPFEPGSGMPYFNEIGLRLESPTGNEITVVAPQHLPEGAPGSGLRFQWLFVDGAPALPSDVPVSGTFSPAESFAGLNGETAAGTWTLHVEDDYGSFGTDPICYYGASLTVETNEHAPVAGDASLSTAFATPVAVSLPGTDADGDPLTFTIDEVSGIGGTVECDPGGGPNCLYTPPAEHAGEAVIAYTVSDGLAQDAGTVTVQVAEPVVASLVVTPSAITVDEGQSVTFSVSGFTAGGFEIGDVTDDIVFSSDVATDMVIGNQITFSSASPHTITATHVPTDVNQSIVIEVRPAAVTPSVETPTQAGTSLPTTGGPATGWLVAGALSTLAGAVVLSRRLPIRD